MTGRKKRKAKPIRVGVIGVGRGQSFAAGATDLVGMKLVALCDTWEVDRKKYEKDTCSPFPSHAEAGSTRLPSSIIGAAKPSKKGVAAAKRIWKSIGYRGK